MAKKKAWHKRHYEENRETERARLKAVIQNARKRNYEYTDELKAKTPCSDCGQCFDPICMDFDHTDNDKSRNVSKMANAGVKLTALEEEIAKCDIVCANCHRIRTRERTSTAG